jgi:hypothetical protein
MCQPAQYLVLAGLLIGASAAEHEDVRKATNLVTSVKMPFPENLSRNRAKNGARLARLRRSAANSFRPTSKKMYDHGIQIALKYFGE